MNLTTNPWIPVLWQDGQTRLVSLTDALTRAADIEDLAVRPHERIALMRLLLCVAHAAFDGPEDEDDWKTAPARLPAAVPKYLARWRQAFELFGDGQRFLQVSDLKPAKAGGDDEGNSASKLDLALATGNNSTLFDNAGGSDRTFTPEQLALMLLSFQCFSPGGTIGVAKWAGKPTLGWKNYPKAAPGQSNHAPCLPGSMLHAFLRGANLAETLHLDLLNKQLVQLALGAGRWGRPVWEAMPASPADKANISNATTTYLGRLVPLSRAIRLDADGRSLLLANALNYPAYPEAREPSATVVVRKQKDEPVRVTLGASLDRAPWRELHSLTVKRIGLETNGGALALQNLGDLACDTAFDLWVGALVADQAKVLDTVEAVFHVPAAMLTDMAQRIYEQGVEYARNAGFRLGRAIAVYHRELGDNLDRAESRNRRDALQSKAAFHLWTDAERAVPRLLDVAAHPEQLGPDQAWPATSWGHAINRALRSAYDLACTHDTPRQMQAYVKGMEVLFRPEPAKETEKAA